MTEHTTSITARAVFDILNPVAPAVENLACHQEQCDIDGVMVKVSRQALDEVLEAINKLAIAAAQDSLSHPVGATDIRPQLRAMPSSLNDACRTMDAAADRIDALVKALNAACGYLLNAKIDLETGCAKATAVKTIEGGLKMAREALATVEPRSNADVGGAVRQGERS